MAMDHLEKKRRLPVEIPHLPKEIIQRIQHFLNAKEAAQTTVLSKSWCSAWPTRPDLDLDQSYFPYRMDKFAEYAKNTIKRYEDLNLNIQSFKLWCYDSSCRGDSHSLATRLIQKALKLGATDIQIGSPPSPYVHFELPDELLRSQTLARLSLSGFIVHLPEKMKDNNDDGEADHLSSSSNPNLNLNFKSLNLCSVRMAGDFIRDVASRWPLIEELTFERYNEDYEDGMNSLLWCSDELAVFPCLKQLVICDRGSYEEEGDLLEICSRSLECIRIRLLDDAIWNAKFDVPNIRKFEYEGSPLSRFQFKETSCNCKGSWESDIRRIASPDDHCECDVIPCAWFSSLNTFVKMLRLSSSRVSLSMNVKNFPLGRKDGEAAVLENLRLGGDAVSVAFIPKMISSCRPNLSTRRENFHCLKELVICVRGSYKDLLEICSGSLECIRIRLLGDSIWNVEFDVPNIRIFEYVGSYFSRFQFKATKISSWESDIRVTWSPNRLYPDLLLNKLVKMLSLSRVTLSVSVRKESFGYWYGKKWLANNAAAQVENLRLEGEAVSLCFVENIILSCRPKFIYIEEQNVKLFEDLKVQPWLRLLDNIAAASIMYKEKKFVGFQLN